MDALQFGRWFSEHRRSLGLLSQRSLVEASHQNPLLNGCEISEDFLARLEAGHFAFPFRNTVRQRVLALAWLLCKTPRDVQSYLRAAQLTDLSKEETGQVERLKDYMKALHTPSSLVLPHRPARFIGRRAEVDEVVQALGSNDVDVCAITGMAGVGKSALAAEALHHLISNQHEYLQLFPDGIITLTGTGRRDISGLISLLQEISRVLSDPVNLALGEANAAPTRHSRQSRHSATAALAAAGQPLEADLASAIDNARLALANKRVLLFLDDLSADFPLRRALEVLLTNSANSAGEMRSNQSDTRTRRAVLITSRYIPTSALLSHHLHLSSLEPSDALALFELLTGRELQEGERAYAQQICAALGYHPLALEIAATALVTKGIPLFLLASHVTNQPLNKLLDGERELYSMLAEALAPLGAEMQKRFVLLSTLDAPTFDLEYVAAMQNSAEAGAVVTTNQLPPAVEELSSSGEMQSHNGSDSVVDLPQLASTAADLGQFIRHSLLELVPGNTPAISSLSTEANRPHQSDLPRYAISPLLRAYAMKHLDDLDQLSVIHTRQNIQRYALRYLEQYHLDRERLKRERDFLLTAFKQAWHGQHYGNVVRFVSLLTSFDVIMCFEPEDAERMLLHGIYASRQVQDCPSTICFMNRLGIQLLQRGAFPRAQRVFEESTQIAEALEQPLPGRLWISLSFLAHLAHIRGELEAAQRYIQTYLHHLQQLDDPYALLQGLHLRAFYRRVAGDTERAYDDLSESMHLLSQHIPVNGASKNDFLEIQLQMEMARVQGDYSRSNTYNEEAVALFQRWEDDYMVADLLFDQADYAFRLGKRDEARAHITRAIEAATKAGAQTHRQRSIALLHELSEEPPRLILS